MHVACCERQELHLTRSLLPRHHHRLKVRSASPPRAFGLLRLLSRAVDRVAALPSAVPSPTTESHIQVSLAEAQKHAPSLASSSAGHGQIQTETAHCRTSAVRRTYQLEHTTLHTATQCASRPSTQQHLHFAGRDPTLAARSGFTSLKRPATNAPINR